MALSKGFRLLSNNQHFAGEDSNFNDIPSLVEHKKKLEERGMKYSEREKAEFFIGRSIQCVM